MVPGLKPTLSEWQIKCNPCWWLHCVYYYHLHKRKLSAAARFKLMPPGGQAETTATFTLCCPIIFWRSNNFWKVRHPELNTPHLWAMLSLKFVRRLALSNSLKNCISDFKVNILGALIHGRWYVHALSLLACTCSLQVRARYMLNT